jgi:Domain of unknown function (DUF5063)
MESRKTADPAIDLFAGVARRYCAWAEGELGDPNDEMRRVRLLLAELHLAAAELPDLGIGKNIDAVSISHDEWSQFYEKFGRLPVTSYFDVFNPLQEEEAVTNSLADDLADIYRDLKAAYRFLKTIILLMPLGSGDLVFKPIGASILSEHSALSMSILRTKASDIVRNPTKPCS